MHLVWKLNREQKMDGGHSNTPDENEKVQLVDDALRSINSCRRTLASRRSEQYGCKREFIENHQMDTDNRGVGH